MKHMIYARRVYIINTTLKNNQKSNYILHLLHYIKAFYLFKHVHFLSIF